MRGALRPPPVPRPEHSRGLTTVNDWRIVPDTSRGEYGEEEPWRVVKCAGPGSCSVRSSRASTAIAATNAPGMRLGPMRRSWCRMPSLRGKCEHLHQGNCPQCQGPGPVDIHTSHKVYSALAFTRWSSHPVMACRSCGRKQQLKHAIFSFALGWWGFPFGLVITPVQVIRNIGGMIGLGGPDPSTPSPALARRGLHSRPRCNGGLTPRPPRRQSRFADSATIRKWLGPRRGGGAVGDVSVAWALGLPSLPWRPSERQRLGPALGSHPRLQQVSHAPAPGESSSTGEF